MVRSSAIVASMLALAACEPKQPAETPQPPAPAPVPAPTPAPPQKPPPAPPGSLRLPVVGEWRVFRTHYGNRRDQSSALDLVVNVPIESVGDAGNSAYPSYGRPIVADGPGVVVVVVDGVPDNPPGIVNSYDQHGNYVVIDHGNGMFSLFAHLIPASMKVRVGDKVVVGQTLGSCGNSGRTSMPHLHWQVMDGAHAHTARGVPIPLAPYVRNGATSNERLERGDIVRAFE